MSTPKVPVGTDLSGIVIVDYTIDRKRLNCDVETMTFTVTETWSKKAATSNASPMLGQGVHVEPAKTLREGK